MSLDAHPPALMSQGLYLNFLPLLPLAPFTKAPLNMLSVLSEQHGPYKYLCMHSQALGQA